jgi:hypothetical protein
MARMFHKAKAFDQSLCLWGQHLKGNADVTKMFSESACKDTGDPTLNEIATASFCTPCDL